MSSAVDEAIVVLITAANGEEAARLADLLVGAHLAPCVEILPDVRPEISASACDKDLHNDKLLDTSELKAIKFYKGNRTFPNPL